MFKILFQLTSIYRVLWVPCVCILIRARWDWFFISIKNVPILHKNTITNCWSSTELGFSCFKLGTRNQNVYLKLPEKSLVEVICQTSHRNSASVGNKIQLPRTAFSYHNHATLLFIPVIWCLIHYVFSLIYAMKWVRSHTCNSLIPDSSLEHTLSCALNETWESSGKKFHVY